jgi:hypothetical protein
MSGILSADIPMADYLAIDALSSGACKALATGSPYAWRNRVREDSPAMSLGTLAHICILEPDRFSAAVVQPKADLRTNAGKEALMEWLVGIVGEPLSVAAPKAATGTVLDLYLGELRPRLAASGLVVLTAEQRDLCHGMRDAVMGRPHTRAIVEASGMCEITGQLDDEEYQIPIKVRPDRLLDGAPVIVSLKTTQSVGDDYLWTARRYGWPAAAFFYMRALQTITDERHKYFELAVESAPPFDCALFEYSDAEIMRGEEIIRRGMTVYKQCFEFGVWPGPGFCFETGEYGLVTIGQKDVL